MSEWRLDVDTEGDLADVVTTNEAYPDEQLVIAEFTDPSDAARCVEAVNGRAALLADLEAARQEADEQNAWWNREIERHNGTKADLRDALALALAAEAEVERLTRELGESRRCEEIVSANLAKLSADLAEANEWTQGKVMQVLVAQRDAALAALEDLRRSAAQVVRDFEGPGCWEDMVQPLDALRAALSWAGEGDK